MAQRYRGYYTTKGNDDEKTKATRESSDQLMLVQWRDEYKMELYITVCGIVEDMKRIKRRADESESMWKSMSSQESNTLSNTLSSMVL